MTISFASLFGALTETRWVPRLWEKDAGLWKSDTEIQAAIRNRLGWLTLPKDMAPAVKTLTAFTAEIRRARFTHAVLLGMGGSSLCPEVLQRTFGTRPGFLKLRVLDSTVPGALAPVEKAVDLPRTLFLVSSKSGRTIEVSSLYRYFRSQVEKVKKGRAGENFVAITDPGAPLEKLARENNFRRLFTTPEDVGGRYSALTYFGLVPAALLGVDLKEFLHRAADMATACGPTVTPNDNPAVHLGAAIALHAQAGRDKLTLLASPEIAGFGAWAEQLIAESTGKESKGVIPVDGEDLGKPGDYGRDRFFVYLRLRRSRGKTLDAAAAALERAGHPVMTLELEDALDLAGEFFRWEAATALAGSLLNINPFDEPNVAESKANTNRILAVTEASGALPDDPPLTKDRDVRVWADANLPPVRSPGQALNAQAARVRPGNYVALMAYLAPTPANAKALGNFRRRWREATGAAVTLGWGPRFLHSTGQLHKGGPNSGVFIQITAPDAADRPIPGAGYGFAVLKDSQSLGDFQALKAHGLRVLRLGLSKTPARDLTRLTKLLKRQILKKVP
jgi:glucose-6-phosphate isomerase